MADLGELVKVCRRILFFVRMGAFKEIRAFLSTKNFPGNYKKFVFQKGLSRFLSRG
jgi:hypothetical protein